MRFPLLTALILLASFIASCSTLNSNEPSIDVRSRSQRTAAPVSGARNIPLEKLPSKLDQLARYQAQPIVIIGATPSQAERGANILRRQGFQAVDTKVRN